MENIDYSRIFYFCSDVKDPMGGIRSNYRIVDILNRNGFDAYILHWQKGFRCQWFKNNTKIAYLKEIEFTKNDYLVLPEFYGPDMLNFDKLATQYGAHVFNLKGKIVIANRGCYHTFDNYPILDKVNILPYSSPDLLGVIIVSEDSKKYIQYAFPELPNFKIFRIRNSIDSNIFSYNLNKKKKICFMIRKNKTHIQQVVNILRYRGMLDGYELTPIDGKTLEETVEIMKESLIFLSFSSQEGFGNPPAEAMLCGCIVIGYHGRGGKEYFKSEFSYPIEDGDIIGFSRAVEEVIKKYNADPGSYLSFTKNASNYIKENYSPEKEETEVTTCWNGLMKKHSSQAGDNIKK